MSLASFSQSTNTIDQLIAGPTPLITRKVTLLSGENRSRGAVLGKKVTAGTIAGAADAANTSGSGTIGTLSVGTGAQLGVYRAVCIEPATNAGTFAVFDPSGIEIGKATVAVAFTGQVNFTIADATDFVSGDAFSITVSAVTEKYLLSLSAATDGSQRPDAVLAEDCDASSADTEAVVYVGGDFDENKVTLGTGHTADSIREGLRRKGIHLIAAQVN